MKRRLATIVIALAAIYAVVWGWWYLTADRSQYFVVFSTNGPLDGTYPRIPLQNIFPDPGFDSPLPAQAFLAGLAVLASVLVLAMVWRVRARTAA